ncbi:bactofilin family protein [Solidesulfovibrio sp.]
MGKHDINAFLGGATSFVGRLTFGGVVRIDGEFDGEILSSGTLVVGSQARVTGRIEVGRLVCDGFVSAEVSAATSVAIHARGRLSGSVYTPSLTVDEGGRLDGAVRMGEAAEAAPALAAGTSPNSSQKPDHEA